ncbi:MAG: methionyl-tRNA formyltransferase [Acidimicrobiia bacterium]
MGTPEAAVPSLRALAGVTEVRLVITRPDRGRGRSRRLQVTPVKEAALALGLEVAQPETSVELAPLLVGAGAVDVGVVVAFGMILRPEALAVPRTGFLNVHFSLLPRWRGAAPVERAIMAGDQFTGVTIMAMDEGLDTGPVVAAQSEPIGPDETGGQLTSRLARSGAVLLAATVDPWARGDLHPTAQPDTGITYAAKIARRDRRITPEMTPAAFVNTVRALAPDPGAQLEINHVTHKVLAAAPTDRTLPTGAWGTDGGLPFLGLTQGSAVISTIQPPGKRPMSGADWLRGRPLPDG